MPVALQHAAQLTCLVHARGNYLADTGWSSSEKQQLHIQHALCAVAMILNQKGLLVLVLVANGGGRAEGVYTPPQLHDLPPGADGFLCVAEESDCTSVFSTLQLHDLDQVNFQDFQLQATVHCMPPTAASYELRFQLQDFPEIPCFCRSWVVTWGS
jgi:hypothetical protein